MEAIHKQALPGNIGGLIRRVKQHSVGLVDRLTENSHVFNMKQCVTLRPKLNPEA